MLENENINLKESNKNIKNKINDIIQNDEINKKLINKEIESGKYDKLKIE